jgi:hypothetical protein
MDDMMYVEWGTRSSEWMPYRFALDVLNFADGQHGFEILDDTVRPRDSIQRTLAFMRLYVSPPPP